MTMLERCARAVKDARALPGTNPVAGLSDVDRRVARAVLEELKEPTPEMVEAGEYAWLHRNLMDEKSEPIRDCFTAMLNKALKDHP